jgi:hypothetical protein
MKQRQGTILLRGPVLFSGEDVKLFEKWIQTAFFRAVECLAGGGKFQLECLNN